MRVSQGRVVAGLLLCLTFVFDAWQAAAQEYDATSVLPLVHECDTFAAHPNDIQRMTEGVEDDKIIPRLATVACEQAIKESPTEPRFIFQLGRALLAFGKKREATVQFRRATEAGHAAAWAYLGDAYQMGYEGEIDFAKALDAYTKAEEGGFEKAKDLKETLIFRDDNFTSDIIVELYNNQIPAVSQRAKSDAKWVTRLYIFTLVSKLSNECDSMLEPINVKPLLQFRYGEAFPEDNGMKLFERAASEADFDAAALTKRHGCDGPVARQLFSNINRFIRTQ